MDDPENDISSRNIISRQKDRFDSKYIGDKNQADDINTKLDSVIKKFENNNIDDQVLHELLDIYSSNIFHLHRKYVDIMLNIASQNESSDIIVQIIKYITFCDIRLKIKSFGRKEIDFILKNLEKANFIEILAYVLTSSRSDMRYFFQNDSFIPFLEFISSSICQNAQNSVSCFKFIEIVCQNKQIALIFQNLIEILLHDEFQVNASMKMQTIYTFYYFNPLLSQKLLPNEILPNLFSIIEQNSCNDDFLASFLKFLVIFSRSYEEKQDFIESGAYSFVYSIYERVDQENKKRLVEILINLQGETEKIDESHLSFLLHLISTVMQSNIVLQSLIIRLFSKELTFLGSNSINYLNQSSYIEIITQTIPYLGKRTKKAILKALDYCNIVGKAHGFDLFSILRNNDGFLSYIEEDEIFTPLSIQLTNENQNDNIMDSKTQNDDESFYSYSYSDDYYSYCSEYSDDENSEQ
ncbi:hypothetical protein TVAG_111440 [Trichomonas vaginalis G3]|uniref:Uncharacterized protein n=1 Tax=Trichomonas vaginalis (strain ATCC PRA-98 / G3) TaxID=412133 RepID=A2F003_TRIV3|nr:armadillo (ARM) repeat-containing protein family [Trichomonas vaginalis G3]EAY01787.1 hypothetical protein TVAG_111440 [Trichomonas vaginalis G3]KAI5546831.1 armadillo (ARM) repeat-containing protein family [Trichomonas vaginalis G3]|eukprot:XP_001314345.1 hypothetical protein [Trichomonas vaginalis G3]